jgi:hypothetical protein
MFSTAPKHARIALYAPPGALLLLEVFWNVHRVSSTARQYDNDDVDVSAARRMPRVVGYSDAIY